MEDEFQDTDTERLLENITIAVKKSKPTNLIELQHIVDQVHGVAGIVTAAEDHRLSLAELAAVGVSFENHTHTGWASIKGLWDPIHDHKNSRATHASYLGARFLEWMVKEKLRHNNEHREVNNLTLSDFIPPIDVSVKVYRVDGLDLSRNVFSAEFSVMLDWEDPSLHTMRDKEVFDCVHFFYPKYVIGNVASITSLEFNESKPVLGKRTSWHVKWTRKMLAELKTLFDPAKYPFDFQQLNIVVEPISVHADELSFLTLPCNGGFRPSRKSRLELQHPVRWRRQAGHTIEVNADWLADFEIIGINGERSIEGSVLDAYKVSIGIVRDPTNVILTTIVSMTVLSIVASFSFFIDTLHHSLALVMTGLLASIAFKLVVTNKLPLTPQPSVLEAFMIWSYLQFAMMAFLNLTIHMLEVNYGKNEECNPKQDWQLFLAANATQASTRCHTISLYARACFFSSLFMVIGQLLYIFVNQRGKSMTQRVAEATWSCVNWGLPDNLFHKQKSITRFIKTISHAPVPLLKKSKTDQLRASMEKALYYREKRMRAEPHIYLSHQTACYYTVGSAKMSPEELRSVATSHPWCGQFDSHYPHMRLATEPAQLEACYHSLKFGRVCNTSAKGVCMQAPGRHCELCEQGRQQECSRPRSWLIGQETVFEAPKSRNKMLVLQVNSARPNARRRSRATGIRGLRRKRTGSRFSDASNAMVASHTKTAGPRTAGPRAGNRAPRRDVVEGFSASRVTPLTKADERHY